MEQIRTFSIQWGPFFRGAVQECEEIESVPLRLAVAYESNERYNVTSCQFSPCGEYFAFVQSPCVVAVYPVEKLMSFCFMSIPVSMPESYNPTGPLTSEAPGTPTPWRVLSSELLSGDSVRVDLQPVCRIEAQGVVQCLAFAHGDCSRCRLPHRSVKRRSVVLQNSFVSLILIGLITGYTEVYNLCDITLPIARIPSLVLFADNLPIYRLCVATDDSLRVASVQLGGDVKLWDLWDDGNMYANLKSKFVFPSPDETARDMIRGEACTFAWQPHGSHICLAGQRGYGVVLMSEKPFGRVATLRSGHFNRISAATYTHDASLLITAAYDSSCVVWSVPEYAPLHHYWHMGRVPSLLLVGGANGHHLYDLCMSPDDLHFLTICEDRCVRLWPLAPNTSPVKTYYELALTQSTGPKLRCVSFSPCGRLISVTTSDNRVLFFTTPSQLATLTTQCLRVLRRCITRYLMKRYPNQLSAICGDKHIPSLSTNRAFCEAASDLPLPPQLMLTLFREFGTLSQPYFQNKPQHAL
ncbi:hypothetical protein T265_01366 [Opisthorchis viverrini]|uniref:Uncharacterized protein n=1 Tax=Opisthorchis viverrini TaxID=6198 RepID=A0A075AJ34_OPIVI|nr:hypothetical protein T265_01366 [Opisthorchis viverrini]KER32689.1 hypothetical protein T265_01366 [Opisthorchis viverrini]